MEALTNYPSLLNAATAAMGRAEIMKRVIGPHAADLTRPVYSADISEAAAEVLAEVSVLHNKYVTAKVK